MTTLNSKIILCKGINLDKDYVNVLNYNENQMLALCQEKAIATSNSYSFIRENKNKLNVSFSYSDCLQANYIAFQNPEYSNKWFFAWINDVNYKSNNTTEITFTIDNWSTWFGNLTPKSCFVIREHVNSDVVGEHTLPENVELGEYITQERTSSETSDLNYLTYYDSTSGTTKEPLIVMAVTERGFDIVLPSGDRKYNGLFSGLLYLAFKSQHDAEVYLRYSNEKYNSNNIYSIFIAPYNLCVNNDNDFQTITNGSYTFSFAYVKYTNSETQISEVNILKYNFLDNNYIPKNKKLLTFPYCYLSISNNSGSVANYHYEDFNGQGNLCNFMIKGAISVGCSIKLLPYNYKRGKRTGSSIEYQNDYSLDAGKLPTCAWVNDPYTNWLTQNAINLPLKFGVDLFKTGTGDASGLLSIAQSVSEIYQHSLNPPTSQGGSNQGDINYARKIGYSLYRYSIKEEYARIIDDYFSRYGYKINRLKTPNITGRQNWNYIQIASSDELGNGDIPAKYMESINQIARKGVTIWHNHNNIGNYNLNNNII